MVEETPGWRALNELRQELEHKLSAHEHEANAVAAELRRELVSLRAVSGQRGNSEETRRLLSTLTRRIEACPTQDALDALEKRVERNEKMAELGRSLYVVANSAWWAFVAFVTLGLPMLAWVRGWFNP